MSEGVPSETKGQTTGSYLEVLREFGKKVVESFGVLCVGAILFTVMEQLASGCGNEAQKVQEELLAHKTVLLSLNYQVFGLAVTLCGLFFMTVGSENTQFFGKYLCMPFVAFIRDGAAIAVGAHLARQVVLGFSPAAQENLGSVVAWGLAVLFASGVLLGLEVCVAKPPRDVKFNWGGIASGVICVVIGIGLIFHLA
jgi:hypothetical protein